MTCPTMEPWTQLSIYKKHRGQRDTLDDTMEVTQKCNPIPLTNCMRKKKEMKGKPIHQQRFKRRQLIVLCGPYLNPNPNFLKKKNNKNKKQKI